MYYCISEKLPLLLSISYGEKCVISEKIPLLLDC
jgi:hypothetical protein